MKPNLIIACIAIIYTGCAAPKEVTMPFYNLSYEASRLQPISLSESSFALRIWINHGTSVERVLSVSQSSDFGNMAYLDEIGVLWKKNKLQKFYSKTKLSLKSDMKTFITKVDSLNLFSYENQKENEFHPTVDWPFSLYVVEIKEGGKYHCFKFCTEFPREKEDQPKYQAIENLIFTEFPFDVYFKIK